MPQLQNYGYRAWAACVAEKVGTSGVDDLDQNQQAAPSPDAFYVEFAPARWSPDLAGFSLLISFLLAFAVIIRTIIMIILRIILRFKYRAA